MAYRVHFVGHSIIDDNVRARNEYIIDIVLARASGEPDLRSSERRGCSAVLQIRCIALKASDNMVSKNLL